MSRKAHWIKKTVGTMRPRHIVFFDTETDQRPVNNGKEFHDLRMGVAKLTELSPGGELKVLESVVFDKSGVFIDTLERWCLSKRTLYIVAHNLVFDLAVCGVIKRLALSGWKLTSFFSKNRVNIFHWKQKDRRIKGLDNGNFFNGTLAYWGDLIDLPKLGVDFKTVSDAELLIYCERDVDIIIELWKLWFRFLDEHDCGSFKPTVSSTAFNTWRHRFMKSMVHIHTDEAAIALERASYRGGRSECLWVGKRSDGPFYYLDVNSMYGHILATKNFPDRLYACSDTIDLYRLLYKLERYAVIADVTIDITEPWFPYKLNRKTCYPVGEFRTTLTTPELKLCAAKGWLRAVHRAAWYQQSMLFDDHVTTFSELRKKYDAEDNAGFSKICKLLVNGLYGKFGQRALKIEIIGECDPRIIKTERVSTDEPGVSFDQIYLAGYIYRESKDGESFHSFPAIAAHVTAYARLYLYRLANLVPVGHVFYMDTDSLVVDQTGYEALKDEIEPGKTGALKIEQQSPWLDIYAPKDYAMQGRNRMKGISPKAEKLGEGVYKQTHWMGLPGLIRAGITEGYVTQEVIKHQRRIIHSGIVCHDGWIASFQLPIPEGVLTALPQLQDVIPL